MPLVLLAPVGHRNATTESFAAKVSKPLKPSSLFDTLVTLLVPDEATNVPADNRPDRSVEAPLRVLLAEDNAVNQKLAVKLLERLAIVPSVVGNGLECVEAVANEGFDLVFMDVQMPEMDGLEATRAIRSRGGSTDAPYIVAMTANAMTGDRDICIEAGMNDYVSKPIRPEALAEAVARAREAIEARVVRS
jgi:CheY-like chemotaxis protein